MAVAKSHKKGMKAWTIELSITLRWDTSRISPRPSVNTTHSLLVSHQSKASGTSECHHRTESDSTHDSDYILILGTNNILKVTANNWRRKRYAFKVSSWVSYHGGKGNLQLILQLYICKRLGHLTTHLDHADIFSGCGCLWGHSRCPCHKCEWQHCPVQTGWCMWSFRIPMSSCHNLVPLLHEYWELTQRERDWLTTVINSSRLIVSYQVTRTEPHAFTFKVPIAALIERFQSYTLPLTSKAHLTSPACYKAKRKLWYCRMQEILETYVHNESLDQKSP